MAEKILMKNLSTNDTKYGFLGYSWTTLFFGAFPALLRKDFLTVLLLLGIHFAIYNASPNILFFLAFYPVPIFVFSFFYNDLYTKKLLKNGYVFSENDEKNQYAQHYINKNHIYKYIIVGLYLITYVPVAFMFTGYGFGINFMTNESIDSNNSQSRNLPKSDLKSSSPSDVTPYGLLYEMFKVPSDYTDLQREEKLKELKDSIVQWDIKIYEIQSMAKNKFRIVSGNIENQIGSVAYVSVDDKSEKDYLASLKTGDMIKIKGKLSGELEFRNFVISPAIIVMPRRMTISGVYNHGIGKYAQASIGSYDIRLPINGVYIKDFCSTGDNCEVDALVDGNKIIYVYSAKTINQVDESNNNSSHPSQNSQKSTLSDLIESASSGNPDAQTSLGVLYAKGEGVQKDSSKAVYWFQKAAEQGHPKAQNSLGVLYAKGTGVQKDLSKAVYWFQKAAEQGHSQAQFHLGQSYEKGHGVEKNIDKAFYWTLKAAEQGHSSAQLAVGFYYDKGLGVKQDLSKAVYWYQKSAEQGNPTSQYCLGILYANGLCVQKDLSKAVYWFQKAAEQGDSQAQFHLGQSYEEGLGVEKDIDKAFYWSQKAAEQGHSTAQLAVGFYYDKGLGVKQDLSKAVYWYQKSAEQGNAMAQFNLCYSYKNGTGVSKDKKMALYWCQKSAKQGNKDAQDTLRQLEK